MMCNLMSNVNELSCSVSTLQKGGVSMKGDRLRSYTRNGVLSLVATQSNSRMNRPPLNDSLSLDSRDAETGYLPTSRKELAPEQAGPTMILSGSPQGQLEQQQPYCVKIVNGTAVSPSAIPLTRSGVLSFPTCFKVVAELFTGAFSTKELTE